MSRENSVLLLFQEADEAPRLNAQQRKFVENYVDQAMPPNEAAREAGYTGGGRRLLEMPEVSRAVDLRQQQYEAAARMTKETVMEGLAESIELAKMKGEPMTMIAGWREVARMCGYYEATKQKVEVSVNGQVLLQRMSSMSDKELLEMLEATDVEPR